MLYFKVVKGTKGISFKAEDGLFKEVGPHTTKNDLIFNREDIMVDPISLFNMRHSKSSTPRMIELANKGYITFAEQGTMGINSKYFLAVPYDEVTIEH